jgi:hypothetical protein
MARARERISGAIASPIETFVCATRTNDPRQRVATNVIHSEPALLLALSLNPPIGVAGWSEVERGDVGGELARFAVVRSGSAGASDVLPVRVDGLGRWG